MDNELKKYRTLSSREYDDGPVYVDDIDERDLSIEHANFNYPGICELAFRAVGRKRLFFKTDQEMSKWRTVDRNIATGKIQMMWVMSRFKEASKYRWSFTSLANAILNTGKMESWLLLNAVEAHVEQKEAGRESLDARR